MERYNSCSQPPSSGINVFRDYISVYNQRHQKWSKRKTRDQFCPTFMLGNTIRSARHVQFLHPSAEELNDTRSDRVKGCPREYTHISHGHTRKGKKIRNSIEIGSFFTAMGCVLSK
jgi:hypothetical protein